MDESSGTQFHGRLTSLSMARYMRKIMRTVIVGHVEWIDFLRVPALPREGDIVHVVEAWEEPAGGGAVSAVQLSKLAGGATFFTALGDEERGKLALEGLRATGLAVEAAFRPEAQRRAVTHIGARRERTITVIGDRVGPRSDDPLPWELLDDADVTLIIDGDVETVRRARNARVLVATSRVVPLLAEAAVELDAIVGSAFDASERYEAGDINPVPRLVVKTEGARGGTFQLAGEPIQRYEPSPVLGSPVDAYGCGDSFVAGLAFALGRRDTVTDAIAFAARCGAAVLTGRGPYTAQLTLEQA